MNTANETTTFSVWVMENEGEDWVEVSEGLTEDEAVAHAEIIQQQNSSFEQVTFLPTGSEPVDY